MTDLKDNSKSYYQQVKEEVKKNISNGIYKTGERIPSERKLCERFSVSRTTIRKAIDELVVENILIRKPGKGTYVVDNFKVVNNFDKENNNKTRNITFVRCVHHTMLDISSMVNEDVIYPQICNGVERTASAHDYHCVIKSINEYDFTEKDLDLFTNTDGIICCELHSKKFLDYLLSLGIPIVLVSPSIFTNKVDIIEMDNKRGAMQAVNHLISLGHQKIGFIGGSKNNVPSRKREEGYIQALKEADIKLDKMLRISYGWSLEDGYKATKELLDKEPDLTAIFAASDLIAMGVIRYLKENDYRIPDDISVVGFDDIKLAVQIKPKLTTIKIRRKEMGEVAANLIFEDIAGKRNYPVRVFVPSILKERESANNCM